MIRILVMDCTPFLVASNDDGKCVVERGSDTMVMGAVRALCEFSLLVSCYGDI